VLVVHDDCAALLAAYDRTVGDRILAFAPAPDGPAGALRLRDEQTGSTWDALGRAVAGPLAGSALAPREIKLPPDSPVAGRSLRDLSLPAHALIAVILRNGQALVPRGDTQLQVGDRVCTSAVSPCGACYMCRAGYTIYCRASQGVYGFTLDGVHAEYARLSEGSLLPLPDSMTFEQGCLVLDPVGTPYHAYKRIGANATHVVGVFGLGPMGLGAVCVGAALGARVIGIEPITYRRDLARKLGAVATLDPAQGDMVRQLKDLTKGHGLDRAMECSGRADALHAALDVVRPFGHVAIIGENAEAKVRPSDHFCRKEITLSGSTCFPLGEFDEIVRLFARGLPAAEMITHRLPLEGTPEGFRLMSSPGGEHLKIVILPHG
jgi:propanol-preferring alcohol dehydrogenase